jgi:hypothetical protein
LAIDGATHTIERGMSFAARTWGEYAEPTDFRQPFRKRGLTPTLQIERERR